VSKGWASSSSRDLWGGDAFHRRCWKTKSPTHPLVEAVKKHMRALSLQYDDEAAAIAMPVEENVVCFTCPALSVFSRQHGSSARGGCLR
jgi:hypothetical protein